MNKRSHKRKSQVETEKGHAQSVVSADEEVNCLVRAEWWAPWGVVEQKSFGGRWCTFFTWVTMLASM